jgi:hypothetical protein
MSTITASAVAEIGPIKLSMKLRTWMFQMFYAMIKIHRETLLGNPHCSMTVYKVEK